ncbi:MAG: hypothetical protein RIR94_1305 [Bacteroidota bacterium]
MLKFRPLTTQELTELETEFKQFLVINALYDDEWRQLAANNPSKAQEFIDLFSNIVLEKVYTKLPGLLHIGEDFITVFDFQKDIWNFYHFQLTSNISLSEINADNFLAFIRTSWSALTLKKGTKRSSEQKAEQVYTLICKGATPLHEQGLQEFLQLFEAV